MPAPDGFIFADKFCEADGASAFLRFMLERKRTHRRGCLGAGCALMVVCVCASFSAAQTSTSDPSTLSTKSKSKTAGANSPAKAAAKKSAGSKTSSKQSHPAAHSSTGKSSKSASAAHSGRSTHASTRRGSKRKSARGQQKIDPERARGIQEALIREHYLSGEAAGTWNQASEDAMRRYQADHGWQSKTVPDSRALISLGLGPSNDHLLNPESAMTSVPPATHATNLTPVSQRPDPGAGMSPSQSSDQRPAATSKQDAAIPQ